MLGVDGKLWGLARVCHVPLQICFLSLLDSQLSLPSGGLWSASLVAQLVKNLPASAEDSRAVGSVPGLGRSLKEEMATHSSIFAWKIPWAEEPVGLQTVGSAHTHRLLSGSG